MERSLLTALILFIGIQFAFADGIDLSPYHNFDEGSSQRLLANDVNMRESASLSAKVVATLKINSTLEILKQDEAMTLLALNGVNAPWYKVKANGQVGYIWAGFIAYKSEVKNGRTLLYGMKSIQKSKKEYENDTYIAELRLAEGNKQLSKVNYKAIGSLNTSLDISFKEEASFKGLDYFIVFDYSDGYCGGEMGNVVCYVLVQR